MSSSAQHAPDSGIVCVGLYCVWTETAARSVSCVTEYSAHHYTVNHLYVHTDGQDGVYKTVNISAQKKCKFGRQGSVCSDRGVVHRVSWSETASATWQSCCVNASDIIMKSFIQNQTVTTQTTAHCLCMRLRSTGTLTSDLWPFDPKNLTSPSLCPDALATKVWRNSITDRRTDGRKTKT